MMGEHLIRPNTLSHILGVSTIRFSCEMMTYRRHAATRVHIRLL
jgi:hypothetical protein